MCEYKIEKNVPVPKRPGRNKKYPFDEMDIGDSVVVPAKGQASAYNYARIHKVKFRCVRQEDGQFRIWRVA
ncbi:MAG: hypothetical protein KDC85_24505 [Saprospiraceae bacterium]|nr:hypothetical protein [Saprospiraceae bacterium]